MSELARSFQFDDSDPVVFEQFFKHAIRGGEERLMLAVLQDAIECFQANALSEQPWEKKLFQEAEIGLRRKIPIGFFRSTISVSPYS